MARTVTVRLKVADVITQLEATKKRLESELKEHPKLEKAYEKAEKDWQMGVARQLLKQGLQTMKISDLQIWGWDDTVRITLRANVKDIPERPERPTAVNAHKESIRVIDESLKLLRMTSQEEVSTSAYRSIVEFL